jgi:sterol desaturase/sphingolipid hydroxylase (fatty acid hydroxylase superfamily)
VPHVFDQLPQFWVSDLAINMRRYIIFAVAVWAILWVVLAGVLRARKIRADRPGARQMVIEFIHSARSIAIFSTVGIGITLLDRLGFYPLPRLGAQWGPVWFWASLALMIVAHDAYYYWAHRAMHHPLLFRRVHRRHHLSHNPSPFTAYSFDVAEALLMASFVVFWPLVTPTPWPVGALFMLHQIFRNTLLHCGYELMPRGPGGKPLFDWLTTTTHHDMHHGRGGNYGLYFTFWDRWMGTEHRDYHAVYAAKAPSLPGRLLDPPERRLAPGA